MESEKKKPSAASKAKAAAVTINKYNKIIDSKKKKETKSQ